MDNNKTWVELQLKESFEKLKENNADNSWYAKVDNVMSFF